MPLSAPLLALALALAPTAPLQAGDPLAPARAGQVQCVSPGQGEKTCAIMVSYTFTADGMIRSQTDAPVRPGIVSLRAEVTVRDGAVCQTLELSRMTGDLGGEGCAVYEPHGDGWRAVPIIDGQRRLEEARTFLWVSPSDGYRLET